MTDYTALAEKNIAAAKQLAAETSGWKVENDKGGAVLDSKHIEGSSINAFRVKGVVNASPKKIVDLLWGWDAKEWKEWADDMETWEIKEKIGDDDRIIYQINKLPWPLWNRDFGMLMSRRVDDDSAIISYVSVDHSSTPGDPKKYVRGKVLSSIYLFEKGEKEGTSNATRILHVDPEGNIPSAVVNKNAKATHSVIENLNKLVA